MPLVLYIRIIILMDKIRIYDTIIKHEGDCFGDVEPMCKLCPLQSKCISVMISKAKHISKQTRLQWALDELTEEFLINGTT